MTRIQWRRDTAAAWAAANPVLAEGEAGFETDTGRAKVGNGSSAWNVLPYMGGINRSVQTITTPTTLAAAANTDYVYFLSQSTTTLTDPFASSVVAQLKFDGSNGSTTLVDGSPLASNWTGSSVSLDTSAKKFGSASAYFNNGNAVSTAATSNFGWGTGPFTVEFFLRLANLNTQNLQIMGGTGDGMYTTGGALYWYVGGTNRISTSAVLAANAWYHIAICRSGTSTRLFVNGTQVGSTWSDSTNYANQTQFIGYNNGTGITGWVDDVRFTKAARYTANFAEPTENFSLITTGSVGTPTLPTAVGNTNEYMLKNIGTSNVSVGTTSGQTTDLAVDTSYTTSVPLLLHFDGTSGATTFTDSSVSPKTLTRAGTPTSTISSTQSRYGGTSLSIGNGLSIATNPGFGVGTGDFTVEHYAYHPGTAGYQFWWIWGNGGLGTNAYLGYGLNNGTINPFLWSNYDVLATTATISANVWQHHAVVRANGIVTIFLNGVSIGSVSWPHSLGTTRDFHVGHNASGGQATPGFFDEFRVSTIARYSTNFTVPTEPFADSTNNSGLRPGASTRLISDGSNWRTV